MGLLDGGLQATFGNVFAPLLLDGTLHVETRVDDGEGGASVSYLEANEKPIKGMVDNWGQQYLTRFGIPETSAVLIVLQLGVGAEPTLDSQITLPDRIGVPTRWALGPIARDPANAAWYIGARPVEVPVDEESS